MFQLEIVNRRLQMPLNWGVSRSPAPNHFFALILEGSVKYEVEGEEMTLKGKDLLFVSRGTVREASLCPPEHHKMYSVHFNASSKSEELGAVVPSGFKLVHLQNFDYIKSRFSMLYELWKERGAYYELYGQAIILEILILFHKEAELGRHSPRKLEIVDQIKQLIHEEYQEPLALDYISRCVDRSPNYICTVFKEITGQTVVQYMNQTRVMAARELLLNSNRSVQEVAELVGFPNPYYFSRIYKRMTGVSPRKTIPD